MSTTVVLLRLATASGKQIRDRGRRCRGRGSVYDSDGGPAPVRRTRSPMRQMRCGGRVRLCRRGGAQRLRCRGEVYFVVGIENGEYSGVLLWVPGWGWLGRVNLKLPKQSPTNHHSYACSEGYDGNFPLRESGTREIFSPTIQFCDTELPVWRLG